MCVVAAILGILCELNILTLILLKTKKQNRFRSEFEMHIALSVCVTGSTDLMISSEAHLPHWVNEQF